MTGRPTVQAKAAVRRVAASQRGYAVAVDLNAEEPISEWYAEIVLPDGAKAAAGPGTTVEEHGQVAKLIPARQQLAGHGVALVAITGSQEAPTHVRVQVTSAAGVTANPDIEGVFVQDRHGRLHPATERNWPGSAKTSTDPNGFGYGGGGGGGGGGQFECDLFVDFANQTVNHRIRTDAGGGGGSGYGGGGEQNNHQQNYQQRRG